MLELQSKVFTERMRAAVKLSWALFSSKVGSGYLHINKEASMQLHYAYILQQLLPLITFNDNESFDIELEAGVCLDGRNREIDLLFKGTSNHQHNTIAIEMKCYRILAASGNPRGASDIFMKDVYEDFFLLEQYVLNNIAQEGIALVMNELPRLINPRNKNAKCWAYDISNGASFGPVELSTPIGGKPVNISLRKSYVLVWEQHGPFWFLEAQGTDMM